MSLYIPKMSDTPAITIPGLADNFGLLDGSQIVEQGSNENGEYIRWENGLQVVFGEASLGAVSLTASGSIYGSPDLTVTLPAAFSTDEYAWHVNSDWGLGLAWVGLGSRVQSSRGSITFRLFGGKVESTQSQGVSFFAIGRWK